jgi:multidrug efflux system membrane fusion protein
VSTFPMRRTHITAIVIAILVSLWLASGLLRDAPPVPAQTIAEQNQRVAALAEERPLTRVRVGRVHASAQTRFVRVRGRTQNKRTVVVKAQVPGILVSRPVERGDRVSEGDLLCQVSVDDRLVSLSEAREALNQARIEYEGAERLASEGLQSRTVIARAKAAMAAASAAVTRSELDVDRLTIRAPFGGVVEQVSLEKGDYVTPGAPCVTLVDLDPMLLVGRVSESEVGRLEPGSIVRGVLATGESVEGPVTFIGHTADEITRTYAIEIQIENADHSIPSGISARIDVPVEHVMAQKVPASLFALDDAGKMGLRIVNSDDRVEFHHVNIVGDAVDGVWVAGLPEVATIITVGQELVVAGEKVDPVFTTN